jgi:hypothetical protein
MTIAFYKNSFKVYYFYLYRSLSSLKKCVSTITCVSFREKVNVYGLLDITPSRFKQSHGFIVLRLFYSMILVLDFLLVAATGVYSRRLLKFDYPFFIVFTRSIRHA